MKIALLHGFLGDPHVWDRTIEAWSRPGDEFIVPTLPGHGPRESVWSTWDGNLAVVAQAVSKADVVVGYSLGGRIALGLAGARALARPIRGRL